MIEILNTIKMTLIGILDMMATYDIDYYLANALVMAIAWVTRDKIDQAAKGGNGVYQWPEILQAACLLLLVMYSLRVIFTDTVADGTVYMGLLGGSGIGVTATLYDKKTPDKPKAPKGNDPDM